MKAERRHQLQANALAQQLETFPEMLKRNASKIMLVVTLVVLAVFLYRYRATAARNRDVMLANAVFVSRQGPRQLRDLDMRMLPPEQLASFRLQLVAEINSSIDTILNEATGDDAVALRAEALVAKGDLNWTLANLSPVPGAATQPAMRLPRTKDDYLKAAEDAYRDVAAAYSGQIISWASAQFGLAAIAENRHDWGIARQTYAEVISNNSVPPVLQREAQERIMLLSQISGPVLLGSYPATQPTTVPAAATTEPTTAPN